MLPVYIACLLLLFGITLRGYLKARQFLNTHAIIDCEHSLEAFQCLARTNMRIALAAIVVGVALFLLLLQEMSTPDPRVRLAIILSVIPVFVAVKILKDAEIRARSLPCHKRELKSVYEKTADTWIKKVLPDF